MFQYGKIVDDNKKVREKICINLNKVNLGSNTIELS
jgi:hypothetical protein